jgi:HPr kinase/phosphorylase
MQRIHGTCVLLSGLGVLLRGPSGSGKSDLALRLIDGGARLVADDQVELDRDGDVLRARAPRPLAGLIEARGVGIMPVEAEEEVPVGLVVDLLPATGETERLPEVETTDLLGVPVRRLTLHAFHASAAAKLRLAAAAPVPDRT